MPYVFSTRIATMGKDDLDDDPYELLGIDFEAGDKEVQTAFRKGSLKCHPDKCPDDPLAAEQFERISRAKDVLLNPIKRAEVDKHRKAKVELEKRFAAEDGKRRKMREDLEGRESMAARTAERGGQTESAEDIRKKHVQIDWAGRIKAKEAERAERQAGMAAELSNSKSDLEAARVRVIWSDGVDVGVEAIRTVMKQFDMKSMEMGYLSAIVQLESREDALRAVLYCRERRHSMAFRVALMATPGAAVRRPPPTVQGDGPPSAAAQRASRGASVPSANARIRNFGDWEKDMLSSLIALAAKQKKRKLLDPS